MNDWIEVERREIGILRSNVEIVRLVVDWDLNGSRSGVVEMRKGDFVFGSNLLSNHNFVDVVELVAEGRKAQTLARNVCDHNMA